MPWCPKCGYEYREDVSQCPDCGSELSDESPKVKENLHNDKLSLKTVLELAAICLLGPLLFYILSFTFAYHTAKAFTQITDTHPLFVSMSVVALPLLAALVIYGRFRRIDINPTALFYGFAAGVLLQVLFAYTLVHVRILKDSIGIPLIVFSFMGVSGIAVGFIWLGSLIKPKNSAD